MATPRIFDFPVKRPGFITGGFWNGQPGADELSLQLSYFNEQGFPSNVAFHTKNGVPATLCLPTAAVIADLSQDLLVSHIRMAGMVSGQIPGSKEYADAITVTGEGNARNYQTPIGDVKVNSVNVVTEDTVELVLQKGSQATRTIVVGIDELAQYSFAPSTQLNVIPGSVKKQFPTYVQDPAASKFLTQAQMDDILAYVLSLELWV